MRVVLGMLLISFLFQQVPLFMVSPKSYVLLPTEPLRLTQGVGAESNINVAVGVQQKYTWQKSNHGIYREDAIVLRKT